MAPQDQEPVGDYGYDMAHEDVAHEDVRRPNGPAEPLRPDPGRPSTAPRPPDLDQDYGYDEAHDF